MLSRVAGLPFGVVFPDPVLLGLVAAGGLVVVVLPFGVVFPDPALPLDADVADFNGKE